MYRKAFNSDLRKMFPYTGVSGNKWVDT